MVSGYCREAENKCKLECIPDLVVAKICVFHRRFAVYGRGLNQCGQFGIGQALNLKSTRLESIEELVPSPSNFYPNAEQIILKTERNMVYISGQNFNETLSQNRSYNHVAAECFVGKQEEMIFSTGITNFWHSFIYKISSNKLLASGCNDYGQLGLAKKHWDHEHLKEIDRFWDGTISQIVCTEFQSLFLTKCGKLYIRGEFKNERKRYDSSMHQKSGIRSQILQHPKFECVSKISGGSDFYIVLFDSGRIHIDGDYPEYITDIQQQFVSMDVKIADIACGAYHGICLDENGNAHTFGHNGTGQCGIGSAQQKDIVKPHRITFHEDPIIRICGGGHHSLLLTQKRRLYGFGSNRFHQIADSEVETYESPKLMKCEMQKGYIVDVCALFEETVVFVDSKEHKFENQEANKVPR